jgi:hypothetical protein
MKREARLGNANISEIPGFHDDKYEDDLSSGM